MALITNSNINTLSNTAPNYSRIASIQQDLNNLQNQLTDSKLQGVAGYSHTGAFAGKPLSNNYVWEAGAGINYTQEDVDANTYKIFSLDKDVHAAVDNPYWTDPVPTGNTGIGLFQGAYLPEGVDTLVNYDYDYDVENDDITHQYYAFTTDDGDFTGYEGTIGKLDLSDLQPGDQLRVRFEFNVIPQIANTTIQPALWYSNRNADDEITYTFALETSPVFYGTGTVANSYLNRVEISAWIASQEDVNALALPAIKSDNPVIIQPLGMLVTIIR